MSASCCLKPIALTCLAAFSAAATSTNKIEFNRDIRPILSENCYLCHGPDKNNRKAKLRLDVREVALDRGAIVPGKPEESEMIKRIEATDPEDHMPPPETHKKISDAQKETLKKWIADGAEYQPHWAYMKIVRPSGPQVNDARWVRNSIDAFILHTLESKKIQPSAEADKRTLLRRLSLDLTGLPPTQEELNAFLKDKSSKAYEKQVDRLLASPRFGERMAVLWLDVARFADTVGYHGDQNQNVFPYRDYVINSFNRNKSFAQFTIEQLAGDLLPNPTAEQKVATCFNRLNMMTREGGAQPKEYLAKYEADRVRTISGAWLGSTMACCECHDHKYDPFTTKDFYSMEAFFADVKQWGVYADYKGITPNPDLNNFGNDHPFPPEIDAESPYLLGRIAMLNVRLEDLCAKAATRMKSDREQKEAFETWRRLGLAILEENPRGWFSPTPAKVTFKMKDTNAAVETNFTVAADSTVSFSDKDKEDIQIKIPAFGWISAIRVEVVPQEDLSLKESKENKRKRKVGSVVLSATWKKKSGGDTKLAFFQADATQKEPQYSMGLPIIGVKDNWRMSAEHDSQSAVWLLESPIKASDDDVLQLGLGSPAIASVRISFSPFATRNPLEAAGSDVVRKAMKHRSAESLQEIYLLSTGWDKETAKRWREIYREVLECRNGRMPVMVTEKREPMTIRVLPRGNWQNESGEIVQPNPPAFLPQLPNPDGHRLTRLDLARWLVSPENPLTARAFMNRMWKQFFGTGISAVIEDLGAQGEWPVHPELLDWISAEFIESGWDVKHMIKLFVLSSTYRQDSNQRPELKDIDPANRLLSCQSPRRLDAEFVRDNALAIAGLLNLDLGGPSAHPYQPAGYYANLQFPDRDYYPDKDDRQYRRGVYVWWQRTFLQPMMANFDAPAREECTANRMLANTPQQGLTLLNDPTFVEASRVFAANVLKAPVKSDGQRIDLVYEVALARNARTKEKVSLTEFLSQQRQHYREHSEEVEKLLKVGLATAPQDLDKVELAAWSQVCRVVLNLHETITRY